MHNKEKLSGVRGIPVITLDEGTNLGDVENIYVDADSKKLSALSFHHRKTGKDLFVDTAEITVIGRDAVLIRSAASTHELDEPERLGRNLRELRGMPITTHGGKALGKLEDFDVEPEQRTLSELHLAGGSHLPIDVEDLTIGPDEIMVPSGYSDRLVKAPERPGLISRVRQWTERTQIGHNPAGPMPPH